MLLELELRYDAWREGGLDALYDDLGARDFLRGRRVTVDGVAGTAQMIARDGQLVSPEDLEKRQALARGEF